MSGAGFVVPDVGAIAETTTVVVIDAFEAMEFAVGRAEGGGGTESGEIRHGSLQDDRRKRGFTDSFDEEFGLLFEAWEVLGGVRSSGPGIGEFSGIPVTDERIFVAFGGVPTAAGGSAIGEMPSEKEFVIGGLMWGESALERDSGDGIRLSRFWP